MFRGGASAAPPPAPTAPPASRIRCCLIHLRPDAVELALGVIGGADQRTRLDVGEADRASGFTELRELLGRVVARDRQVLGRRPQVLAEGQDVDVRLAQVAHRLEQLVALFAQTEDDAGLGQQARRRAARPPEELQRALVAAAVARELVEARHRLGVVVEDVRRGVDHDLEGFWLALEVGDQQLDAAAGRETPERPHRRREGARPAVGQVVTVHRRDDDVLEAELAHGAPHALRLLAVLPDGLAVRDRAVAAVPRADVAQDHEGRGRIFPALADVRAVRLFADRVEVPLAHEPLEPNVVRPAGRAHL